MKKKILIIAAHPDDEILGCGGTVARLVKEGHEAYTLILGEGITSRDDKRYNGKRASELKELRKQALEANKVLGIKEVFFHEFPDNRFDTVPILDVIKVVEKVKNEIRPSIIFTHYNGDLNIDHQITYQSVITSTRPLPDEPVKEIYSFEVLSSTEWNYPSEFSPNAFYDIRATLKYKLKAMEIYKSELRDYPHPRSIEGIRLNAEYWGMHVGLKYAEAFKSIRIIR